MKIKTISMPYEEVLKLKKAPHQNPCKPNFLLSTVERLAAIPDLSATHFKYSKKDMEKAGNGPWLILMNHSSFLDLEIISRIMYPKTYNIVCTTDGFVGKPWLMHNLGCIPTNKFIPDIQLISDISYAIKKNKTSVLMYPEASYSFDGRATKLPRGLGILFKRLGVPVVMVTAYGSFTRDPLYNNLQKRKVNVSAEMRCLLTPEECKSLKASEIDDILDNAFSFDYFKWQQDNSITINESFRADGLNRILYKCPCCKKEGQTEGKGTKLICRACGKEYELDERGFIRAVSGETEFRHIPDWNSWQRDEVKKEIENGSYNIDLDVEVGILVDYKAIYMVGSGRLTHNENGFTLTACDGKLHYTQSPTYAYSTYSDFFWYEIGDIICIGDKDYIYYCFPKEKDVVSKIRMAAEEMYKLKK